MSEDRSHLTTALLQRMAAGDEAAADDLLPLVYEQLHEMARHYMARQPVDHTLEATALINEAWIKLAANEQQADWQSRAHFVRVASKAMRSVLVDYARSRQAQKRGDGRQRATLEEGMMLAPGDAKLVLALDSALERLNRADEQLGRIAELRCFGGLSNAEIAHTLGISERTVERGWRSAKAHLKRELDAGLPD